MHFEACLETKSANKRRDFLPSPLILDLPPALLAFTFSPCSSFLLLLDDSNEEAHACEPTSLTTFSLPASFPQFLPSILLGLHGKVRVSGEP